MTTHFNPKFIRWVEPLPPEDGGYDPNQNQWGTIFFNNTKQAIVLFGSAFDRNPSIVFTPNDSVAFPPFKSQISKTGFTVKLQCNWLGSMDWLAVKRL